MSWWNYCEVPSQQLPHVLFALTSAVRVLKRGFSPVINPTPVPRWWAPIRAKKLSETATDPEIFARWHLVITVTSSQFTIPFHCRVKLAARNIDKLDNVQLLISFTF